MISYVVYVGKKDVRAKRVEPDSSLFRYKMLDVDLQRYQYD